MNTRTIASLTPALLVALAAAPVLGQAIDAVMVIKQGDEIAGSTVSAVNAPFMDSTGAVGLVVSLADARRAIIRGTPGNYASIFDSGMALPDALVGGESTMGISSAGGFIYSPSFNGEDAVYTQAGLLLAGSQPAPGFPGLFSSFNSRPRMVANGTAFWVGGTSTTAGGATSTRVLYRATDPANLDTITPVITGGQEIVPGLAITAQGIGFDYDASDDGQHLIGEYILTGSTATNDIVVADGVIVIREGDPVGDGFAWTTTDGVAINNSGDWLLSADTTAPTSADRVMVLNGEVILREGETHDGLLLGAAVNALAMDNNRNSVFIWTVVSVTEALFYRSADGVVTRIAAVGDQINTDGIDGADFIITDFNASGVIGPGLDLADTGLIYAHVDLMPIEGGAALQAAIGFARPGAAPTCPADYNNDGNVDPDDLGDFINCYFSVPPCPDADFNNDGSTDPDDLGDFINIYFATVAAGGC